MYWSEVKLLLRYLIYNCDDPKTYISLALTCKYASELARYYAPMKMREFCREIIRPDIYLLEKLTIYVLPNGKVLKVIGDMCEIYYNIRNKTMSCINKQDTELPLRKYEMLYSTSAYVYKNIEYSISDEYMTMEIISGKYTNKYKVRSDRKCNYCNCFHDFWVRNRSNWKIFYLSSYCGMNLTYYTPKKYSQHHWRRRIVHAVIEYAKKMKEENDQRK